MPWKYGGCSSINFKKDKMFPVGVDTQLFYYINQNQISVDSEVFLIRFLYTGYGHALK